MKYVTIEILQVAQQIVNKIEAINVLEIWVRFLHAKLSVEMLYELEMSNVIMEISQVACIIVKQMMVIHV